MKLTKTFILILLIFIILSGCSSANTISQTEIITEEPLIIGYIVEIDEDKDIIHVVENISKEEALNGTAKNGSWVQINGVNIESMFEIGNKIAVWDSVSNEFISKEERKVMPIAKRIVLIEDEAN